MLHRRAFIRFAALGAGAMLVAPRLAFASLPTDRRFVFVIQRGAADGLDIVAPLFDPAYAALRGQHAINPAAAMKLDGGFALHPALIETGKLYAQGQALFVHAVASPYRDRSHFDAQNVLETGGIRPYELKDGWLNRLIALMPKREDSAIAVAPTIPLALRGPAEVSSYAASALPQPSDDLLRRVGLLYEADAQLHPLWTAALETRAVAAGSGGPGRDPASLGRLAASFLAKADGPRIAMIETEGWDTHSAQPGRLANQLKALDTTIGALRDGMGPAWSQTTVLVATEFGRTVAINGTNGTDHGTASVAWLVGGAVKGGRVIADWPGLGTGALLDGRDLRPTADLDALILTAAAQSLRVDAVPAAKAMFPDRTVKPFPDTLVTA